MDIRTKLVFILVLVALGSMLGLGLIMYASADGALKESRLDRLDGLAESKVDGLEQVFAGWVDRVRLVASRTQLRLSLEEYTQTGSPRAKALVQRILNDAVESVSVIRAMAVFDPQGEMVASAGGGARLELPPPNLSSAQVEENLLYLGVVATEEDLVSVGFLAILRLEGFPVGTLLVKLNAESLAVLAEDRSGMGETGETLILGRDDRGIPRALHRSQADGPYVWEVVTPGGPGDLFQIALLESDTVLSEGVVDKDGNPVWAAFRYLPESGLRLVVKVDRAEGREPLEHFRRQSFRLGLSLAAFALVVGTIIGLRFTKPISELTEVAVRIREGALSARAGEEGEDEISLLARTFNHLAHEMEDQVTLLREFQRYFELSRDMLCIAGPDGYFKRVNPAFEKTLGWSTEVLLSKPFLAFVHPDDKEKTEAEMYRLAKGLPTISFQNRYQIPSGEYRHLMWTAHPDEESGLIYAVARDVTDLAEERERTKEQIKNLRQRLGEAEAKVRGAT